MRKGDYIICRAHLAGVFAGVLVSKKGKEVTLKDARRIWHWGGAASLSQLSQEGVKSPQNCKFPCEVPLVILTEAVELLPVTQSARESIKGVAIWRKKAAAAATAATDSGGDDGGSGRG